MKLPISWRRGLLYGAVCGAVGAILWAAIALSTGRLPDLLTAMAVGTISWAVVGFVVGALKPQGHGSLGRPQRAIRRTALGLVGQYVYRTVIGLLVGGIAAALVEVAGLGLATVAYGDITAAPRMGPKDLLFRIGFNAFVAGAGGGFIGGLVGAWLCTEGGLRTSIRGSLLGTAFAFVYGAFAGAVVDWHAALVASLVSAGVAGILGAILARVLLILTKPSDSTEPVEGNLE